MRSTVFSQLSNSSPCALVLHVHMMRFVGDQHDFVLAKILEGEGVFFFGGQVGVQLLDRGEADVDVVGIDRLEVLHRRDPHAAIADVQVSG